MSVRDFGPDKAAEIEVCGARRFWAITGNRYPASPTTVNECGLVVAGLINLLDEDAPFASRIATTHVRRQKPDPHPFQRTVPPAAPDSPRR